MSAPPQEQDRFGCYTVLRDKAAAPIRLGVGPWGAVFKAFNADLLCYAALRIVQREAFPSEDLREQFVSEARSAERVRHQRLASVFPLQSFADSYVYATEFCAGKTVADLLAREEHGLPLIAALAVTSQVAAALDCAGLNGLLHRNITLENMLLVPDAEEEIAVKLLDLALPRGSLPKNEAALSSSSDLRSPQEAAGEAADVPAAIFSLGALFYCLSAGPQEYASLRASDDTATRVLATNEILARTLCHDPAARLRTFAELRDLIEAAIRQTARLNLSRAPAMRKDVAKAFAVPQPSQLPPQREERKPPVRAKAPPDTTATGALAIPPGLLGAAQAGTVLRLKPFDPEKGLPMIACARDYIHIGRSATAADLVVRFLPRNRENDAKTKLVSNVHITAKCEHGQLLLLDGDGLRPSGNGSTFDKQALSTQTTLVLQKPGELRLADEYSIQVIPLPATDDQPVIANLADWDGPKIMSNLQVSGAVLFAPDIPAQTGVALWLFSVAYFTSSNASPLDFARLAGVGETGALRHFGGCFWLEQRSKNPLLVDEVALGPSTIAPLMTGQIVVFGDSKYTVHVE